MCAVKLGYIGETINDIKLHDIEEKSYDPRGQIKDIKFNETLRDLAVVCSINNKAGIKYEDN